jgi:hypothetical protein
MAIHKTPNLNLDVYDPAESASTYVRDWISYMSNLNGSNMTIIDSVVGNIIQYKTPKYMTITGDGTQTTFTLNHGHNTLTPFVIVYSSDGKQMHPKISVNNNAEIQLEYIFPLDVTMQHTVAII